MTLAQEPSSPSLFLATSGLSSYLASQTYTNPSLAYDAKSGSLYDATLATNASIQTAVIAGYFADPARASRLAALVGPGMLAGLVVPTLKDEDDTKLATEWHHLVSARGIGGDDVDTGTSRQVCEIHPKDVRVSVPSIEEVGKVLEVDDIVLPDFTADGAPTRGDFALREQSGAGIVLMAKICGALAGMGYAVDQVVKVGGLVGRNLMTAAHSPAMDKKFYSAMMGDASTDSLTKWRVKSMLGMMLAKDGMKMARTVNVNSNEVVLLINDPGRAVGGEFEIGEVVCETVQQLHEKWNIWPVRIYAGQFLESENHGFSLTLLNVVNTDIGGPSMVQLLDASCEARGWHGFVRKETWDGRNMLMREDKGKTTPVEEPSVEVEDEGDEEEAEVENDAGFEAEPEATTIFEAPAQPEEESQVIVEPEKKAADELETLSIPGQDSNTSPDVEEQVEVPESQSKPAFEFEDNDRDRPSIQHPTWESEQTSLLDLIQMQASRLVVASEKGSIEDEHDTGDEGEEHSTAKKASDDGFELI